MKPLLGQAPKKNDENSEAASHPQVGLTTVQQPIIVNLLTRKQVSQRLGVCCHTCQRLTRRGLLPAIVFNSRLIRYAPEVIEAYIKSAVTGDRGPL